MAGDIPLHDAQRMRRAGADLLSLALIDARNHLLRWVTAFEAASSASEERPADALPPLWLIGQAGWFPEFWIARNVQRQRGEHCDAQAAKLASIEPLADASYDPRQSTPAARWSLELPGYDATRHYLVETLETTLELLGAAGGSDDALHFFRLALQHEDWLIESLAEQAQALDLDAAAQAPLWAELPARVLRDALWFPSQCWEMGSPRDTGFTPDAEKWAHEVGIPEFEIDAQAVSWAQFLEFVEDGGYDDERWWSNIGLAWLHDEGRRCPRYVEQLCQGVIVRRQGRMQRASTAQPVLHVTAHEAEAWCRWAGRRLPTEAEWELAAATASSRGFVWGDVWEWTIGSARAYPGHEAGPVSLDPIPEPGMKRVLRGGSWMTPPRMKHPKARRFAAATDDLAFCGFRSCAF
jgi:ergothioneine biosynthesis protein EgtB